MNEKNKKKRKVKIMKENLIIKERIKMEVGGVKYGRLKKERLRCEK